MDAETLVDHRDLWVIDLEPCVGVRVADTR